MTTPGPQQTLPRLADALREVSGRLAEIGDELRVLQVAAPPPQHAPQPAPQSAPQPVSQPAPQPWPEPYPFAPYGWHPHPPRPEPARPSVPWGNQPPPIAHRDVRPPRPGLVERLSREGAGSRLLAWLGGGVTLAGVVLLLVLAVQRGYIGPLPRILAGAGLGAALVAIGLVLLRRDAGRVGGLAVTATGFAGLYLDVVAATSGYRFLPVWGGLLAGLAVAAAGIAVADRVRSQVFAVFVVLACVLSAPILTGGPDALLLGFLLVLQIATAPVHVNRSWRGLALAAGVPPVVAALAVGGATADAGLVLALCVVTGVVQLAVAAASALRDHGDRTALGLAASAPLPVLLAAAVPGAPAAAAVVLAGVAALFATVWVLERVAVLRVGAAFALVAGFAAVVAGFEAICLAFADDARTVAVLAVAVLLALLGERLRYAGAVVAAAAVGGIGLLAMLGGTAPLAWLARPPRGEVAVGDLAAAGVAGVLLTLGVLTLARAADRVVGDDVAAARTRWIAAAVLALYGTSTALLAAGFAISPDADGFRAGHVLVTVSWTVTAIVLLLRRIDAAPYRVAGLALVGAAVAKLALFDLASLSGIPRVTAFLAAGLVLLAAGAKYAAMVSRQPGGST